MVTQELKDKFVDLLKSMFQLDQPELDFGLYKIMHSKADRINKFLDTELNQQIDEIFSDAQQADKKKEIEKAKQNVIASLGEMAFDENGNLTEAFKTTPAAQSYLSVISSQETAKDNLSERGGVYDHLIRFFSRYYDGGDFMSRRYHVAESDKKAAPYAVPYDGSEVNLHWANKDQYYIKTTESFNNYSFDIAESINQAQQTQGAFDFAPQLPSKAIHFKLVDVAEGEHNNNKEAEKRVFFLHLDEPIVFNEKNELVIQFEYRNATKNDDLSKEQEANLKQKYQAKNKGDLPLLFVCNAIEEALNNEGNTELTKDYLEFIAIISQTDKIKNRPLLFKYLKNFVMGNTMDYFIHKNLKSFLQRELDFYIKNEIIKLDDVEQADAPAVEMWLKLVKSLRRVASEIIQFLAQLEDFQKKLWLKKKFVTETNYCFTIDKLESHPELLELVLNNESQKAEWKELYSIDLNEIDSHKQNSDQTSLLEIEKFKYLPVDTNYFDEQFIDNVLAIEDQLDSHLQGHLIHSENFQALNFIKEKFAEKINCIYIDPPYNSGGNDFIYKDAYRNSSWLSMLFDRVMQAKELLPDEGVLFVHIDDKDDENKVSHKLMMMIESIFGQKNYLDNLIWIKNTTHNDAKTFSHNHEYILAFAKKRYASSRIHELFRQNKPGYAEVMEITHSIQSSYPTISEIESKIKQLYAEQIANYKASVLADGKEWNDEAKKSDPWKGIKQYKFAEYRDEKGKLVAEKDAKSKNATIWVFREDNPAWPNANSLTKEHKDENDADYRFFNPIHPMTGEKCPPPKTGWRWRKNPNPKKVDTQSFSELVKNDEIAFGESHSKIPQRKRFLHTVETDVVKSTLPDYTDGEKELANIIGERGTFPNPKPTTIGRKLIEIATREGDTVLDFFSGSGSAIQATINQNFIDEKSRHFIGVEMGEYFDRTLLKRVKKSIYSIHWKDGKVQDLSRTSSMFKYFRLEAYEDTINNLIKDKKYDLSQIPKEFTLGYLLDAESQGSNSMLNISEFSSPRDYKLNIKQPNSDQSKPQNIDLIETFNWLIGLTVDKYDPWCGYECDFEREQDPDLPEDQNTRLKVKGRLKQVNAYENPSTKYQFRTVLGFIPRKSGNEELKDSVLIIWRKLSDNLEEDAAVLEALLQKLQINQAESQYDRIYINGPHGLQLHGAAKTRLINIEEAFTKAMWAGV